MLSNAPGYRGERFAVKFPTIYIAYQEKIVPPENFYPRTKIFSNNVENFCPTLKIFVRLARPCLAGFSRRFQCCWLHVNVFHVI